MKKLSSPFSATSLKKQILQLFTVLFFINVCLPAMAWPGAPVMNLNPAKGAKVIQGSIQNNPDPNKVDIVFKANYTSTQGEYINFLQFALAIPAKGSEGVTAKALGVNTFSNMGTLIPIEPYIDGTDRIFGWVFAIPTVASQSWVNDVAFTGVEVTFSKTGAGASGKLINFTNRDGGTNLNTYFAIVSSTGDRTSYNSLFFQIPAINQLGTYTNNDQYVQNRRNVITSENSVKQLAVTTFPNPYEKSFKFDITSPVSGMATIQFYNTNGSKIYDMQQQVEASVNQVIEVKNTASFKGSVFYKISVGDYNTTGTVVKNQ